MYKRQEEEYIEYLGNKVVCHSLPIRPGRNLAVICETAAVKDVYKRQFAVHTAWNFTQNILFGLPNSGINVPYSVFKLLSLIHI